MQWKRENTMETIGKIATMGLQAALDAIFDEAKFSEDEKIDRTIKLVNSVTNKVNAGLEAYQVAKPLHDVLLSYNRETAILLVCEFYQKYDTFIRIVFGHCVQPQLDLTCYNINDFQLQNELKFLRMVVYLAAATEEGIKAVGTELIKWGIDAYNQHKQKKQEEEQLRDYLFQQYFGEYAELWKLLLR